MATNDTTAFPRDAVTNVSGRFTQHGDQRFSQKCSILSDHYESTTLDTTRWTETTNATGTSAISNGVLLLSSGTNSAGSVLHESVQKVAAIPGTEIYLRVLMRYSDDAIASNTREVGIQDSAGTTGAFLELDGTDISVVVEDAGPGAGDSTTVSGLTVNDNEFFLFEMTYSKDQVRYFINGGIVDTFTTAGLATPLMSKNVFSVYAYNVNSGSTTDSEIEIAEIGCYLIGDVFTGVTRHVEHISGLADAQVLTGPGFLEGIVRRGAGSNVWNLRDGSGATDRIITKSDSSHPDRGIYLPIHGYFAEGIYFDHVSGISADTLDLYVRS